MKCLKITLPLGFSLAVAFWFVILACGDPGGSNARFRGNASSSPPRREKPHKAERITGHKASLQDAAIPGGTSQVPVEALLARIEGLEARVRKLEGDPLGNSFRLMKSPNPALRRRGIRSLKSIARHDAEALNAIRDALNDHDIKVRMAAAETLSDLEDRESVPGLCTLLSDPDPAMRCHAMDALVELGAKEAGSHIAAMLLDADEEVRADAANALGMLKAPEGVDPLIVALRDTDVDVRGEAINALGRMQATEALPELLALVRSGHETPSFQLLKVIQKLGNSGPYNDAVHRLSQEALTHADEKVRCRAIRTLGRHAPRDAREVFRQALQDASGPVRKEAKKFIR